MGGLVLIGDARVAVDVGNGRAAPRAAPCRTAAANLWNLAADLTTWSGGADLFRWEPRDNNAFADELAGASRISDRCFVCFGPLWGSDVFPVVCAPGPAKSKSVSMLPSISEMRCGPQGSLLVSF